MRVTALQATGRRRLRLAVVDGISDGVARLEVGERMRSVPAADLSPTAREGDVLVFRAGRWRKDADLTRKRREAARERLQRLLHRQETKSTADTDADTGD